MIDITIPGATQAAQGNYGWEVLSRRAKKRGITGTVGRAGESALPSQESAMGIEERFSSAGGETKLESLVV